MRNTVKPILPDMGNGACTIYTKSSNFNHSFLAAAAAATGCASDLPSGEFRLISIHAHRVCRRGALEWRCCGGGLANLRRASGGAGAKTTRVSWGGVSVDPLFSARHPRGRKFLRYLPGF